MKKALSFLILTTLISGIPAYGMFRGLTKAVAYSRIRPMSTTTQTTTRMKQLITNPWVTFGSLFSLGSASAYAIKALNNEIDALESVNHTLTETVKTNEEVEERMSSIIKNYQQESRAKLLPWVTGNYDIFYFEHDAKSPYYPYYRLGDIRYIAQNKYNKFNSK